MEIASEFNIKDSYRLDHATVPGIIPEEESAHKSEKIVL